MSAGSSNRRRACSRRRTRALVSWASARSGGRRRGPTRLCELAGEPPELVIESPKPFSDLKRFAGSQERSGASLNRFGRSKGRFGDPRILVPSSSGGASRDSLKRSGGHCPNMNPLRQRLGTAPALAFGHGDPPEARGLATCGSANEKAGGRSYGRGDRSLEAGASLPPRDGRRKKQVGEALRVHATTLTRVLSDRKRPSAVIALRAAKLLASPWIACWTGPWPEPPAHIVADNKSGARTSLAMPFRLEAGGVRASLHQRSRTPRAISALSGPSTRAALGPLHPATTMRLVEGSKALGPIASASQSVP